MHPIRYTISFPAPHTHNMEVAAEVPTDRREQVELMMAVWTPGSYLIREYARHVENLVVTGQDGERLVTRKSAKNRWTVKTAGAAVIRLAYALYGREMSVRTNWIESAFALINGAPTFITLADGRDRSHEVSLSLPSSWSRSVTALPSIADGSHDYRAETYDMLVDSPILVGEPAIYEFVADGKVHVLANEGEAGVFDGGRAQRDLSAIVHAHHRFWRVVPYHHYVFINLITEARGGLEHASSTVLMTSRWATRTRKAYLGWLELASHEFFHVWNGKRLRPLELGPFDYEREAHTSSLWIVEGITDYYGDLLVHRAGLSTQEEFLASLSEKIDALQTTPGRGVQSIISASYDAWIKHYRPDENSPNSSISYYVKGAVLAFLLDVSIRRASAGARSLDDVMRTAYDEYSGTIGFSEDQFRSLVERVAGVPFAEFWTTALEGIGELDYGALSWLGLRFKTVEPSTDVPPTATLGAITRVDSGRLLVAQVRRGTPAHAAGINVDDEILAFDDFRVRPEQLDQRMQQYLPGDRVSVLVSRRDRLIRLDATLAAEPLKVWQLEADPTVSAKTKANLESWLTGNQ